MPINILIQIHQTTRILPTPIHNYQDLKKPKINVPYQDVRNQIREILAKKYRGSSSEAEGCDAGQTCYAIHRVGNIYHDAHTTVIINETHRLFGGGGGGVSSKRCVPNLTLYVKNFRVFMQA